MVHMMKMNKCPCNECILLAICINRETVRESLDKCQMLVEYLKNKDRVEDLIKFFKPDWYERNPGQLSAEADHLFTVIKRKRLRAKREKRNV